MGSLAVLAMAMALVLAPSLASARIAGTNGETTIPTGDLGTSGAGLAQLGALRGMSAVVLFSTEPGNVALNGKPGEGSPSARIAATELARRQSLNAAFLTAMHHFPVP